MQQGIGTINKIQTMLETMYMEKYYYKVGMTMIESMLLGSIPSNIEVAYNLSISEIEKFEKSHENALRRLLSLPCKSPKQMFYFLTGSTPIRFIIHIFTPHVKSRRPDEHQMKTKKAKD